MGFSCLENLQSLYGSCQLGHEMSLFGRFCNVGISLTWQLRIGFDSANILISQGMIILATNRPFDLDEAMHRRITLAIEFSKPDACLVMCSRVLFPK